MHCVYGWMGAVLPIVSTFSIRIGSLSGCEKMQSSVPNYEYNFWGFLMIIIVQTVPNYEYNFGGCLMIIIVSWAPKPYSNY